MSLRDAIARVRSKLEADDLLKPDVRHYTPQHQEIHCTCFTPERWICKEHQKEYQDCGCTPPIRI